MYLTVLDAMRIQDYVFGSNKLKDNIGGSEIIDQALNMWPVELIQALFGGAANPAIGLDPDPDRSIFLDVSLIAELFYAGGGNTVFFFREREHARRFAQVYSIKLLHDAPGLNVACIHKEIGAKDSIAESLQCALLELTKKKQSYTAHTPLLGLGVTALCGHTGKPAQTLDEDGKPISRETAVKRLMQEASEERFGEAFKGALDPTSANGFNTGPFVYPREFDDLGRSMGDTSYMGVIHMDGNGMGRRITQLAKDFIDGTKGPQEDYIQAMRVLSRQISDQGKKAVQAGINKVRASLLWNADRWLTVANKVELSWEKEVEPRRHFLPLRPIIYGGDDITLVCDGRIALDLASFMLQAFQCRKKEFHACAGVAIVKTHYPFARAYRLAEDLCRSAKRFVRENCAKKGASAIDWHIMGGGVDTDIAQIRRGQYETRNGEKLTGRPYLFAKGEELVEIKPTLSGHSWHWFRKDIVDEFLSSREWKGRHTRLRRFAEILRLGEVESKRELQRWRAKGIPLLPGGSWADTDFHHNGTPYIDAIEIMDMLPSLDDWGEERREE